MQAEAYWQAANEGEGCEMNETERRDWRNITCAKCGKEFRIRWNDSDGFESMEKTPITLNVHSCISGGIYKVSVDCPHCGYEEDV